MKTGRRQGHNHNSQGHAAYARQTLKVNESLKAPEEALK